MALVTLIGTFHMELAGEELINKALQQLNPDLLVAESNDALDIKATRRQDLWSGLFDYLAISPELRKKFFACQPYKEHLLSKSYAREKKIPLIIVDLPEEIDDLFVEAYSGKDLVKSYREDLDLKTARQFVIESIEREYERHFLAQGPQLPNPIFYDGSRITSRSIDHVGERDVYMAQQIKEVLIKHSGKRICGFFGMLHLVDPNSKRITDLFEGKFKNLRYYLGEENITYASLIDFV
ncbi:MAG: hypothetical protein AABW48_01900 [Nanoarchaeota archaeon]